MKGAKMPNPENIKRDLSVLAEHSKADVEQNRWASYIANVPEFNRLFEACKQIGIDVEGIDPITDIPHGSRSPMASASTPEEQAKTIEVARKSEQLRQRLIAHLSGL